MRNNAGIAVRLPREVARRTASVYKRGWSGPWPGRRIRKAKGKWRTFGASPDRAGCRYETLYGRDGRQQRWTLRVSRGTILRRSATLEANHGMMILPCSDGYARSVELDERSRALRARGA